MEVNSIQKLKINQKKTFFLNVALNQAADKIMFKVIFDEYYFVLCTAWLRATFKK